jgi:alcohol dehydrogenase (NADP+)
MPIPTRAYAAFAPTEPLGPHSITRRDPGPRDVAIDIDYCGICHSDVHFLRGEWGPIPYPAVAGHEIIGRVTAVGDEVTRHQVGDTVGVGCMVDSCRTCPSCQESLENYCTGSGSVGTYMGVDKHTGGPTYGGYSSAITVDEDFVLRIPANLDLAGAAPLLCAGITTWSPLRHWKVGKGSTVGVVGLGGLGHMGVKLASAMGAEVVVFTTSPHKVEDARALGANDVVISTDEEAMAAQGGRFDFILDTVAAPHPLDPYIAALRRDGTLCLVGAPASPHPSPAVMPLIAGRRSVAGSLIGGIAETQEMLDFCGEHGITSQIETISMEGINEAHERMLRSDVKYRFVIDMKGAARMPEAG